MSKLVSVVIPTYNRQRLVVEAIESVLAQTYRPIEIIVSDDGSTDGTEEELRRFQGQVRFLTQSNQGVAAARNMGIRAATGEYVALLDSDDLWAPAKIEKQIAWIERCPEVGVVYCQGTARQVHTGVSRPLPYFPEMRGDVRRQLLYENRVTGSASAVLIRRSCLDQAGPFDESLRSAADWDMWIRLSRLCHFACVEEPLVTLRFQGDNISKRTPVMFECQMRVIERAFREDPVDGGNHRLRQQILAFYYWNTGVEYLWVGEYRRALRYLTQSSRLAPFARREMAFLYRAPRSHLIAALRRRLRPRPQAAAELPARSSEPSVTA